MSERCPYCDCAIKVDIEDVDHFRCDECGRELIVDTDGIIW